MKGHDDIIELLNEVLTAELTAINQYFVDAKMCQNWGYERLAKRFRDESIDEMKDADKLIERILYLDGLPNLQRLGTVRVGETPVEKLQLALELEHEAIERLNRGIARCVELATTAPRAARGDPRRRGRRTPTGSRPSSSSSASSASRTTSPSTSTNSEPSPGKSRIIRICRMLRAAPRPTPDPHCR